MQLKYIVPLLYGIAGRSWIYYPSTSRQFFQYVLWSFQAGHFIYTGTEKQLRN